MAELNLRTFFVLIILLQGFHAIAQSKDTIYWNGNRKLKWEDFKGKPDNGTNLLAMTQAGIGYEFGCNNGELRLKIYCYFNVNKSWTKETESDELLEHEQVHFNITELYTRKLRKRLGEINDPCGKNVKEMDKIYRSNFEECARTQDLYDKETNHSTNKMKQREWEERITKELNELKGFSGGNH